MEFMEEVFFSIDVEANGPIPVKNSMLSLACVAFAPNGAVLGRFERNLNPLPGAVQDPKTMTEFWAKEPEAWAYCTSSTVDAEVAMSDFVSWVKALPGKQKVAVCMPAGFDFTYVYMYLKIFGNESPFSFSCIDMKTYFSAMSKLMYRESGKKSWPRRWFDSCLPHTHKAIDDALEQGFTFIKMKTENEHGVEALERVSACFWNSLGGKPGTIFSFEDGRGRVEMGDVVVQFPKKALDDNWTPVTGDSVLVRFTTENQISGISKVQA